MTTTDRRYNASGIAFVVATLIGWSSVLLFLKHLAPFIDAWTANGWRYGLSAIMWLPLIIVGYRRSTLPEGIWRKALVPSIFNCLGQACFALTVYYIDPGFAGFLLRVSLIFSTGGSLLLFADERMLMRSPRFWLGLFIVVTGAVGTVAFSAKSILGGTAIGIILGATAGAFFGLYGVSVRYWMRGIPAVTSFSAISLLTAIGMVGAMLVMGDEAGMVALKLSPLNWVILVGSAVIGIALGHVFYYAALARLGVAVASAVIQFAPFLGGAASVWIFDEELTLLQWVSGGILLAGAFLLLQAERHRDQGPQPGDTGSSSDDAAEPESSPSLQAADM